MSDDKAKIRKLRAEIKKLKAELAEQKSAYEFLWKMRVQDEMERKKL